MSLDVQSELNPQAGVAEISEQVDLASERLEALLFVVASGLATVIVSATWVALSLA